MDLLISLMSICLSINSNRREYIFYSGHVKCSGCRCVRRVNHAICRSLIIPEEIFSPARTNEQNYSCICQTCSWCGDIQQRSRCCYNSHVAENIILPVVVDDWQSEWNHFHGVSYYQSISNETYKDSQAYVRLTWYGPSKRAEDLFIGKSANARASVASRKGSIVSWTPGRGI